MLPKFWEITFGWPDERESFERQHLWKLRGTFTIRWGKSRNNPAKSGRSMGNMEATGKRKVGKIYGGVRRKTVPWRLG